MTEATRGYRELIAWQKAMQLVPAVYRLVKQLPAEERYALSDQLRRAVDKSPGVHAIRHSRGSGNPLLRPTWMPAFAGMTVASQTSCAKPLRRAVVSIPAEPPESQAEVTTPISRLVGRREKSRE
ncbi:MAG: four helix bundle protein [Candidatus Binatia bacterium]